MRCDCKLRDQFLAATIVGYINRRAGSAYRDLNHLSRSKEFASLSVAEINSAGGLHKFLRRHSRLAYSEYGGDPNIFRSEDLMNLSYKDDTFDLVITAESLEHVPDILTALREIYRILKPGGVHLFSVPIVWDQRATRQRASVDRGSVVHLMSPSYHGSVGQSLADYLVFSEIGSDFCSMLELCGFITEYNRDPINPALTAFVCVKPK